MRRFQEVDVFSPEPLQGNPVAVVVDAEGLTSEQMQRFTRWTNLSEATFLLPPTDPAADYRVRIFTAAGELPFAGHPTLGSCHACLRAGGQPRDEEHIVHEVRRGPRAHSWYQSGASTKLACGLTKETGSHSGYGVNRANMVPGLLVRTQNPRHAACGLFQPQGVDVAEREQRPHAQLQVFERRHGIVVHGRVHARGLAGSLGVQVDVHRLGSGRARRGLPLLAAPGARRRQHPVGHDHRVVAMHQVNGLFDPHARRHA